MMDAIVQLLRNSLCTAKNFNFLGDTFLYDAKVTAQYYSLPPPLDETTPLELLIAVTQLYACVSLSLAGYRMISGAGVAKLQVITRLVNLRAAAGESKKGKKAEKNATAAKSLINTSLLEESDASSRSFIVGVNIFALGVAFFWLFANSLHVTSTDWIGGVEGLIYALAVMEVNLLVFLYYMVIDAGGAVRKSFRMKTFAYEIASAKKLSDIDMEYITVEQYGWLVDGWAPFWAEGATTDAAAEEKMLIQEEEGIASKLAAFSKKIDSDVADRINAQARMALFEGYREYLYLVLNFFAFYGYLVCIVVFYYQDEGAQPEYIRAMMGWMPNADADWLGNAVGDFMWTVEPVIILGSPLIMNSMSPKGKKEKVA